MQTELSEIKNAQRNNPRHFDSNALSVLLVCLLAVAIFVVLGYWGVRKSRPITISKDGIQVTRITEDYGPHGYHVSFVASNVHATPKRVQFLVGLVALSSHNAPPDRLITSTSVELHSVELHSGECRKIEVNLAMPGGHGGTENLADPYGNPYVDILHVDEAAVSSSQVPPGST